jgi:hypothetical protein
MVRANQGLWVGSSLPSREGQYSCGCSKPQASMQPSFRLVSPFLLWPWRAESPSGSTWQSKQHSPYSIHQRRCHRRLEDGHWDGAHPTKVRVTWSTVFLKRPRGNYVVQGSSYGPKDLRASPQDHGWGSLLEILYPPRNQQDVPRFDELLVDKDEERDCMICVRVWHVSKGQGRSFEASWKSATFDRSRVEVGKHLHKLHCGFASHLARVQFEMGHCGPPNQVSSLYTCIHHIYCLTVCQALPIAYWPLSWYPEDHYLWQRVYLCGTVLGTSTWLFGHPSYSKFSLSPLDWWANWMSQSSHWRYATCVCSEWWTDVGQASPTRWVLIQQ